jgi:hypothetical protein
MWLCVLLHVFRENLTRTSKHCLAQRYCLLCLIQTRQRQRSVLTLCNPLQRVVAYSVPMQSRHVVATRRKHTPHLMVSALSQLYHCHRVLLKAQLGWSARFDVTLKRKFARTKPFYLHTPEECQAKCMSARPRPYSDERSNGCISCQDYISSSLSHKQVLVAQPPAQSGESRRTIASRSSSGTGLSSFAVYTFAVFCFGDENLCTSFVSVVNSSKPLLSLSSLQCKAGGA